MALKQKMCKFTQEQLDWGEFSKKRDAIPFGTRIRNIVQKEMKKDKTFKPKENEK